MAGKRPSVNNSDDAAYQKYVSAQLGRLRSAIAGKQHWIIATDNDQFAAAVRGLAWLLAMRGATDDQVILIEVTVHVVDRATKVPLRIAAISKAMFSAPSMAGFVSTICGSSAAGNLAAIQAGADVVPLSEDVETIAVCLEQILRGRVSFTNSNQN